MGIILPGDKLRAVYHEVVCVPCVEVVGGLT